MQRTIKNIAKSATSGKNKYVLVIFAILAISMYMVVGPLDLLAIGGSYTSAYEGAKASFAGIEYNGRQFTVNTAAPYYSNTGTGFSFKGDGPSAQYRGLPKIVGEMTSVFIPEKTSAGDLPASFKLGSVTVTNPFVSNFGAINNPYHTYSWTQDKGSYTDYYTMEEWKTKFYVSISANPDGQAVPFVMSEWDQANGRYSDLKVWVKLDTAPTWYFQGQEKAYFAIAQVQLSGISYKGHSPDGAVQASHGEQLIAVNPSSPSSVSQLYLRNFGAGGNEAADPQQIYSYKGTTLNPQYFGNSVYFPITLNNFGSQSWFDWTTFKAQGDVVTFDFTITQFVVGKWTVQDLQPTPSAYGRQSSYSEYGLSGVTDFFNEIGRNPLWQLIILAIVIMVILIVLAIFAPGVLKLFSAGAGAAGQTIQNRTKKSGKKK